MRRLLSLLLLGLAGPAYSQDKPKGLVVCVSAPAAEVGAAILRQGGNAVDATAATAFALAVTWPEAGNIGGGGFMLIQPPGDKTATAIDYREMAPAAANAEMFAKKVEYQSHLTTGVPGSVRGLGFAHKKYGRLPWAEVVRPAVKLAEEGFVVNAVLARGLNAVLASPLTKNAEFRRVYGKNGGKDPWQAGDRLVNKDLGRTLRIIMEQGADGFYSGDLADKFDAEMTFGAGLITKQDLAAYTAIERKAMTGTYRGHEVIALPPPSAGGTTVIQMLNMLETFDIAKHSRHAPETVHLMSEVMRRAYRDRAEFLGDPAFTKIPEHLTTKEYAKKLAACIDLNKATKSEALAGNIAIAPESNQTTHFSIVDADGLAVANTTTLENSYGNRVVVRGCGYILNNEMTDFNHRPGITDRSGRVGTAPNLVAGGKRMLSSMCPTILRKDGKTLLITGSPGGRTIPNTVLNVIVNVVDYRKDVQVAVDAPRLHQQWFPDRVMHEEFADFPKLSDALKALGHTVGKSRQGDAHSIHIDPATGVRTPGVDRRLDGKAVRE